LCVEGEREMEEEKESIILGNEEREIKEENDWVLGLYCRA